MTKKEQAIYFLGRIVRDLERQCEVDHEALARRSAGYTARQLAVAEAEKKRPEAEALRWALDKLQED